MTYPMVTSRDFPLQREGLGSLLVPRNDVYSLRELAIRLDAVSMSFLVYTRDHEMLPLVMGRSFCPIINSITRSSSSNEAAVHCDGGVVRIVCTGAGSNFFHGLESLSWDPRQSVISRIMTRALVR